MYFHLYLLLTAYLPYQPHQLGEQLGAVPVGGALAGKQQAKVRAHPSCFFEITNVHLCEQCPDMAWAA
jgi:hypothetical protein